MTGLIWFYGFPLLLGVAGAYRVKQRLFPEKRMVKAILQAREVVYTERELMRARENKGISLIIKQLKTMQGYFDLERLILRDIRQINGLMGIKTTPERELAGFIARGLISGLPVIIVPFLTGFAGYIAAYPLAAAVLTLQSYRKYRAGYEQWQKEIIRDLPDLIDKLRISLAGGRDFLAAFTQARDSSGPKMRAAIDQLINDLQCMRPSQALDVFASSLNIPVAAKFASAVKIAVEYGYESAENYFRTIENDIMEVRRAAIEELTKSKPERVYQLYIVLLSLAVGSLLLKGWEIFSQIDAIF